MNHEQLPLPDNAEDVSFVEVSKDAKKAMQQVITDYLILKDALVSADKLVAQKQLGLLMNDFEKVGMQLPGSVWEPYKIAFTEVLKSMGSKDLEAIRKLFKPLSQSMIAMVQQFKPHSDALYVQYCPMFEGDKGGSWLSISKDIKNPYFGDMMLSCGEVKKEIKP